MSDKELDIRGIELQGAKKYIVDILNEIDAESKDMRSGFGWLFNSKKIQAASIMRGFVKLMLDDINERIAKHIPS